MTSRVQALTKEAIFKHHTRDYERLKRWVAGAKVVAIPSGVAALTYWALQERPMQFSAGWNSFLILGVLISQVSIYVFALRFRCVMKIAGLSLSVTDSLRINTLAMFYHFFVPLSIGAEVTKLVKLRAVAPDRGLVATVGGIALDHFVGLATLILISTSLIVVLRPVAIDLDTYSFITLALSGLLIAALLVLALRKRFSSKMKSLLERLQGHQTDVFCAFGLSVFMQLLIAAAVFVGSFGWGLEIGYFQILFVLTGSLIFQGLPINLAGVGVAEIAGTGLYIALGLPASAAVLLVSLLYCYRILIALIGGLWELTASKRLGAEIKTGY